MACLYGWVRSRPKLGRGYAMEAHPTITDRRVTRAMPAPPNQQAPKREGKPAAKTSYEDVGDGSLSGNLTKDPELRFTPDGKPVATLRVAETERIWDEDAGRWTDGDTEFYDVIAWADLAEHVCECLGKGDRIAAVGRWQKQAWTDPEGNARTKTVLVARDLGPSLLFRHAKVQRDQRGRKP